MDGVGATWFSFGLGGSGGGDFGGGGGGGSVGGGGGGKLGGIGNKGDEASAIVLFFGVIPLTWLYRNLKID